VAKRIATGLSLILAVSVVMGCSRPDHGTVAVRVDDVEGTRVAGTLVQVWKPGESAPLSEKRSDEQGWVTFEQVPVGLVHVDSVLCDPIHTCPVEVRVWGCPERR